MKNRTIGIVIILVFICILITSIIISAEVEKAKISDKKVNRVGQPSKEWLAASERIDSEQRICYELCEKSINEERKIEFCGKTIDIRTSHEKKTSSFGKYRFCASKIPCFYAIQCIQPQTSPSDCREALINENANPKFLRQIVKNIDSENNTFDDGCGLLADEKNWKIAFRFVENVSNTTLMQPAASKPAGIP